MNGQNLSLALDSVVSLDMAFSTRGDRCYDPVAKRLRVSRHVTFWEHKSFSSMSTFHVSSQNSLRLFTNDLISFFPDKMFSNAGPINSSGDLPLAPSYFFSGLALSLLFSLGFRLGPCRHTSMFVYHEQAKGTFNLCRRLHWEFSKSHASYSPLVALFTIVGRELQIFVIQPPRPLKAFACALLAERTLYRQHE